MIAENESSDSSSDSSENLFKIHECSRSNSTDSLQSAVEVMSKSNLLVAPSASATSILERVQFAKRAKEIIDKVQKYAVDVEIDEIGFTRPELQKRLQNLVAKSFKCFNGDIEVK